MLSPEARSQRDTYVTGQEKEGLRDKEEKLVTKRQGRQLLGGG